MPSHRKRIGFLPSQEVHDIIDKLCRANELSQSKVTGLLVEEALMSRGVLNNSLPHNTNDKKNFINDAFEKESLSKNNKSLYDDIKMMHEFIEFKYFKKVMKQNNNIFE